VKQDDICQKIARVVFLAAGEKQVMINNFKILAKSLLALVLLINAGGLRSQTPGRERRDNSSRDKQRLARFEKQADELRTLLKIPGKSRAESREWGRVYIFDISVVSSRKSSW
jgi:hypothetical protein